MRPRSLLLICLLCAAGCDRNSGAIRAGGMIEMDEIDVASLVGGRVSRLYVVEGDTVRAGDTLAVLERDEVLADLRAQAAAAKRAEAQAREVSRGPRKEEIEAARSALASADAQLKLTEAELARISKLFSEQVVAQAELDRAQNARDEAVARRDSARENLGMLEVGSRREQIEAAHENARSAQAALQAAESRSRELVLIAPTNGVVLLKNFERGELAQPNQPVVTLGNPDSLWVRAYLAAPLVSHIRLNSPATVHLTGDKRKFPGRVAEIATRAEFTPRAALTEEERASIVFAIKVVLDPTNGALKAGVPADVEVERSGE
jgi:HlyD family secretion protein